MRRRLMMSGAAGGQLEARVEVGVRTMRRGLCVTTTRSVLALSTRKVLLSR